MSDIVNVTRSTADAVQAMVTESFLANAKVDRIKSVLTADLAYNNTSDKIHYNIAHYFPVQLGDTIGDLIESKNQSIIYGGIPTQEKEYSSADEAISDLLEIIINYQDKLNKCAKLADGNMDTHVYSKLMSVIKKYDKLVEQGILLSDKSKLYKDDPSFDHDINKFWIL